MVVEQNSFCSNAHGYPVQPTARVAVDGEAFHGAPRSFLLVVRRGMLRKPQPPP